MEADYELTAQPERALLLDEEIEGAQPNLPGYHLYPGDLLQDDGDGSYTKFAPGVPISGLLLTTEQQGRLKAVSYDPAALSYNLSEED